MQRNLPHQTPTTSNYANQRLTDSIARLQNMPGTWAHIGTQISNSRARPYRRAGFTIRFENQTTPGISDISVSWPDTT